MRRGGRERTDDPRERSTEEGAVRARRRVTMRARASVDPNGMETSDESENNFFTFHRLLARADFFPPRLLSTLAQRMALEHGPGNLTFLVLFVTDSACMFHESRVLIQHFADCFTVRLLIFFAFSGNGLGVTACGKWPACFPRHPRPGAPHRASRAQPPSHASGKLAREFRATFESPRERPPRSNLRARSGTRVFRRGASAECAHEKSRRVARFSLAGDARLSRLSPPRPSRSRAFRVAARASFPRPSRAERFDSSRGHGDPLFHHRRRPGENHVRTRRDFPRETRSRGRRARQHRRRRCRRARARGRPGELPLDPSPRPARVPAQGRSQEGAFPGSTPWRTRILAFRHSQKYLAPRCLSTRRVFLFPGESRRRRRDLIPPSRRLL